MAARTTKTDEQKAAEAQAAEDQKAADEQAAADKAAADAKAAEEQKAADDDQPRDADGKVIEPPSDDDGDPDAKDPESTPAPQNETLDTIPAVEHSAPAVENAEEIAEKASPKRVTEEDGVAAFRPPQTRHTAWTLNTLAESEGGSELGIEQTSGNADVTKDPAGRPDADETE